MPAALANRARRPSPITSATPVCEENRLPTSAGTMRKQNTSKTPAVATEEVTTHAERQVEDQVPTQELAHVPCAHRRCLPAASKRSAYEPMECSDDAVEHDELQQFRLPSPTGMPPTSIFLTCLGALWGAIDHQHGGGRREHIEDAD